jgi:hypothetical protein
MAKEWIEKIAEDIRTKHRDAAEEYGRKQHYAEITSARGKEFFVAFVLCLKENIDALRSRLQGDPASSEIVVQNLKPAEVRITRARFPWVDARLTHDDETIMLDYAKGPGTNGDPRLDRKTCAFAFRVTHNDALFVEEAFVGPALRYEKPDQLARHITEVLFGA